MMYVWISRDLSGLVLEVIKSNVVQMVAVIYNKCSYSISKIIFVDIFTGKYVMTSNWLKW